MSALVVAIEHIEGRCLCRPGRDVAGPCQASNARPNIETIGIGLTVSTIFTGGSRDTHSAPPGKKTPVSPSIYRKDSYRYLYGTCVVRHPSSGLLRHHSQTHRDTGYLMVSPSSDAEPANIRASMG